jgi:hypothetical protein
VSPLYDIYEVLPDGQLVWRVGINDKEEALRKIIQMAIWESRELRLIYFPTKAVVASVVQRKQTAVM